ncbi:MAG: iron export ABC transporter permease subunit FetB [Promethearchaeia archaeon]
MLSQISDDLIFGIISQKALTDILIRFLISLVLLAFIIALSYWNNIGMEQDFLFSFARGFIQIILAGAILTIIFEIENIFLLYGVMLFMCGFAAHTGFSRYDYGDLNSFKIQFTSITIASMLIMILVPLLGIIPMVGEFLIPMGGSIISNTMVISNISLERVYSDVKKSRGKIEAALALGDTPSNAISPIIRDSFRAGLTPSTNRVAVLGIVTIPGYMSGMIIGGIEPVVAAIYQVIIFLMILASGFMGEIISAFLLKQELFTEADQLLPDIYIKETPNE